MTTKTSILKKRHLDKKEKNADMLKSGNTSFFNAEMNRNYISDKK
jgi:hypothetical protein